MQNDVLAALQTLAGLALAAVHADLAAGNERLQLRAGKAIANMLQNRHVKALAGRRGSHFKGLVSHARSLWAWRKAAAFAT